MTEQQLRRWHEEMGRDPQDIEDAIADWADREYDRMIDDEIFERAMK